MFYYLGNPALPRVLIVTPAVYPRLVLSFFPYRSRLTQLRISKPSKKHSHSSSEFPDQNFRQICPGVHELWSDIQTNKHPKRDNYFIYRWKHPVLYHLMQIYEYVKDLTFCRESKGHMFKARYHDTFIILTRHLTPPLPSLPLPNIFLPPPIFSTYPIHLYSI